ncbi:uncharacterized protein LOC108090368 [Drosophila ficusphila]|uniref:uncharacterized protein LOC108090368 n=1 Tax=Drosophila ficusphila TaxID=30025 RepID=UPI0007E78CC7|nr:uncharacterized protein LOC108090368 [Drosophila ficusphila]
MLSLLAKRIRLMPSIWAPETSARIIHISAQLERSCKSETPCPESQVPICKTIRKRPCSSADPPVRPCSEEDCSHPRYPCCVNTRIAGNPCMEPSKNDPPLVSMWEGISEKKPRLGVMWQYPEECCPPCGDVRFDVLYYKPSDKCRDFQRTWWECCPRMVPKRVCCWCDAIPPEVLRRDLPICPRSACLADHEKKRFKCLNKKSKGCTRVQMPCCRTSRIPPNCKWFRSPSDCEKIKCPFPSFSECVQEDPAMIPQRPPECKCLANRSLCEAVRQAQRLSKSNCSGSKD